MVKKSDLPFGSEFSPSQINLMRVLEFAQNANADWKTFEGTIKQEYFHDYKTNEYNKGKLANNTKLGMIAYGLIDRDANLTELGQILLSLRNDESLLYSTFARHILLNLHGMSMVQCIQDMTFAGEQVNLTSLREALGTRGIHYPPGGKHPSMMRLWLAKAGIFIGTRWQVDEICLKKVLGINSEEFGALANFTSEQRAFVRALANTGVNAPQPANQIARLAAVTYGVKFPEKSLPKLVLNKLVESGYISIEKTTTGRGAKPFLVSPTDKLIADIVNPLLEQLDKQVDPALRKLFRKPLAEITKELKSTDRYIAGLALEALGFKLMRLIDIDYIYSRA